MQVTINKDIRKYKAKDIGNFSIKQALFIAGAMAGAGVTYYYTQSIETALIPMVIVLCFGFLKIRGMSLFTFIRTVVAEWFSPIEYIYESDFVPDKEVMDFYKDYDIDWSYFYQTDEPENIKKNKTLSKSKRKGEKKDDNKGSVIEE